MWVSKKVEELREEVAHLKADLEMEKRRSATKVHEAEACWFAEEARRRHDVELKNAAFEARIEEMKKQLAASPYSQLSDILKALVVKLPTLDIKELSVHGKEK